MVNMTYVIILEVILYVGAFAILIETMLEIRRFRNEEKEECTFDEVAEEEYESIHAATKENIRIFYNSFFEN